MWAWLQQRYGRRATIPDSLWQESLAGFPYAAALPAPDRERLRQQAGQFLRAKTFEGAGGLVVTDAMRLAVALQACTLILNLDLAYYAGWQAVILYPGDFRVAREQMDEDGVVHQWSEILAGESWQQGPVILSWDTASLPEDGINVVLHEFAHKLDMRNGPADGYPPLPPTINPDDWAHDFQQAYDDFTRAVDRNEAVRLDAYAAESPAEFFAVLSETFFLQPQEVRDDFPAVYDRLRSFYRQDPLRVLAGGAGDSRLPSGPLP